MIMTAKFSSLANDCLLMIYWFLIAIVLVMVTKEDLSLLVYRQLGVYSRQRGHGCVYQRKRTYPGVY